MESYSMTKIRSMLTVSIALFVLAMVNTASASIIYVDYDARGANVGTSWEHAINSLQDALLLAYFYDEPVEIRVAQGTYTPDEGIGIMPGDREASFQLLNNVTIKGGYAGTGTRDPEMRDTEQYTSILSGDLYNDYNPRIANREENSFHVVTANGTNATAVLDGFTITGGNADGPTPHNYGGGMYNDNSNPTLINCTFSRNSAGFGGGIYIIDSYIMLVDCIFRENSTIHYGGGMYNDNSNLTLLNCVFTNNSSNGNAGGMLNYRSSLKLTNCSFIGNAGDSDGGGGMLNQDSSLSLADCIFSENLATGHGAGIYNNNSNLELLNCEFIANSSQNRGGGIYSNSPSQLNLTNCIFSGNSAYNGGGMENLSGNNSTLRNCTFSGNSAERNGGGISNTREVRFTLINSILWGNTPDEISGEVLVLYSDIEGGWHGLGEGNFNTDPQFADPDNGDYHLKSQAGRWNPISESWIIDEVSSPCIDAGDPESPVGLERFPNGNRINIGAYGGTPQASLSPRDLQLSPFQASNPYPANGAVDVEIDVILQWIPGLNAISHNIYFGLDFETISQANLNSGRDVLVSRSQIESYYDYPGILDAGRTYYWRVDEVIGEGEIITGAVWSFTTLVAPPKGRACFTAETPVWIDGALVPISKAGIEQTICRINSIAKIQVPQVHQGTPRGGMARLKVQEHEGTFVCYDVLLKSGNCISVAECHYFLEESGRWISLQELKAGTKLQTTIDSIEIISITKRPAPYVGKVYNLKIEGSDRYLVGEDAIIARDY